MDLPLWTGFIRGVIGMAVFVCFAAMFLAWRAYLKAGASEDVSRGDAESRRERENGGMTG